MIIVQKDRKLEIVWSTNSKVTWALNKWVDKK